MKYFLYILCSKRKETYYIGASNNPKQRHFFHNHGSKGFTLRYRPWELKYTKAFKKKKRPWPPKRKLRAGKAKKWFGCSRREKLTWKIICNCRAIGCYPDGCRDAGSAEGIPWEEPCPGSLK